jgi:hypothetical protein
MMAPYLYYSIYQAERARSSAQQHWPGLASHATGSAYVNVTADGDDHAARAARGTTAI